MSNDSISGPGRGDGPTSGKGGPSSGAMDYAHSTAVDIARGGLSPRARNIMRYALMGGAIGTIVWRRFRRPSTGRAAGGNASVNVPSPS